MTPDASCHPTSSCGDGEALSISPATWDGVIQHIEALFPEAISDLKEHIHTLEEKTLEYFEEEAGFRFLDAKKNRYTQDYPPYFSYKYFCSLPKPRSAWQVRAFLYCELRLHKLFTGDGHTCNEGDRGMRIKEYLCPNTRISDLDSTKSVVLPMRMTIPEILCACHQ